MCLRPTDLEPCLTLIPQPTFSRNYQMEIIILLIKSAGSGMLFTTGVFVGLAVFSWATKSHKEGRDRQAEESAKFRQLMEDRNRTADATLLVQAEIRDMLREYMDSQDLG